MAWRCKRCGKIYEGERWSRPGLGCPDSLSNIHEWVQFESTLDKQNELLEKQNKILEKQNKVQSQKSPSVEEGKYQNPNIDSNVEKLVKNDSFWNAHERSEKEYSKLICDFLGWDPVFPKTYIAKLLYDDFSSITCTDPLKALNKRRDLIWVLSRDTNCNKKLETNSMTGTQIGQRCEDLTSYYGINNKIDDDAVLYDYLESFQESNLFRKIQNNTKDPHYYFIEEKRSFYPQKYCEFLDEVMMKKDGKRKWNEFLQEYRGARSKSIWLVLVVIGVPLFLLIKCII